MSRLESRGWCTFSWTSYIFLLPFMVHYSLAFFFSGYFHFIEYCNCFVPRGVRTPQPLLAGGPHIILSPRRSLDLGLIRQLGTWNKHWPLPPSTSLFPACAGYSLAMFYFIATCLILGNFVADVPCVMHSTVTRLRQDIEKSASVLDARKLGVQQES